MSIQRRINKRAERARSSHEKYDRRMNKAITGSSQGPEKSILAEELEDQRGRWGEWVGPNHPDKGKANGRCNRTACQLPLADEPIHQFMDENFTGGPRLHYCKKCSWDFDKWDRQSGDRIRIKREDKV